MAHRLKIQLKELKYRVPSIKGISDSCQMKLTAVSAWHPHEAPRLSGRSVGRSVGRKNHKRRRWWFYNSPKEVKCFFREHAPPKPHQEKLPSFTSCLYEFIARRVKQTNLPQAFIGCSMRWRVHCFNAVGAESGWMDGVWYNVQWNSVSGKTLVLSVSLLPLLAIDFADQDWLDKTWTVWSAKNHPA